MLHFEAQIILYHIFVLIFLHQITKQDKLRK